MFQQKRGKFERVPEQYCRSKPKILVIILLFLLICIGGIFLYIHQMLNLIDRTHDDTIVSPTDLFAPGEGSVTVADVPVIATEPVELLALDNVVNILLIGEDMKEGGIRGRADTTILCTFNTTDMTITMTSFLRDMYVQIPEQFPHKFNSAYALGGFTLLDETLTYNFGIQVDGNVCVDFASFETIINMIGGVTIELSAEEVEYLNTECGFDLHTGRNHVDGLTALAYSRIRHLDSDFGRTNRQRNVMSAIFDQCHSMSLIDALDLLQGVLPLISTDMTNQQTLSYAVELFPLLMNGTITTQAIPAEGTYTYDWADGMSILAVDLEANQKILADTLSGSIAP